MLEKVQREDSWECSLLCILEKQLGVVVVDITKTEQGSALEQLYQGQWQPELKLTEMLVQEMGRAAGPS